MDGHAKRAFAAMQKDPTQAAVLINRWGAPIWATPSVFGLVDVDLDADDPIMHAVHPDDRPLCTEIFEAERAGRPDDTYSIERRFELIVRLKSPSGRFRPVALRMLNLVDDPEVEGLLLQMNLANQETSTVQAFDAAASGATAASVVAAVLGTLETGGTGDAQAAAFDMSGRCIAATPGAGIGPGDSPATTGWAGERLELRVPINAPTGEQLGTLETRSNFADVRPFTRALVNAVSLRVGLVLDGERSRDELRRHAEIDALTGLSNRRSFRAHLRHSDLGEQLTIVFVDINNFKAINDRFGHEAGDAVLVEVGRRMAFLADPGDFVARLGGDEFVMVRSADSPSQCAIAVDEISRAIDGAVVLGDARVEITCSVGVASGTAAMRDALLARADMAMYRHKREGRGTPPFRSPTVAGTVSEVGTAKWPASMIHPHSPR